MFGSIKGFFQMGLSQHCVEKGFWFRQGFEGKRAGINRRLWLIEREGRGRLIVKPGARLPADKLPKAVLKPLSLPPVNAGSGQVVGAFQFRLVNR